MFTYFLALVAFAHLDTVAPDIQAGYETFEECQVDARRANRELIQPTKENKAAGMRFVCLKMMPDA